MSIIHETAVIADGAQIGKNCHIGPFCSIGDGVTLGENVRLESHVVIDGNTSIGDGTHVFPFVSIGLAPQDLKYAGEPTSTEIGKNNHIREFVTIHRGTCGVAGIELLRYDKLSMAQTPVSLSV